MKTIESLITPRGDKPCEDGIIAMRDFVAVIDGCTCLTGITFNGKLSGEYAKDIAIDYFYYLDISKHTPKTMIQDITHYFKVNTPDVFRSVKTRPRAMIIIYNALTKEVWSYGDCQALIDGELFKHEKKADKKNGEKRTEAINAKIKEGETRYEVLSEYGRLSLLADIEKQYADENKPDGYPVINGLDYCEDLIQVHPVKNECILATDGYPFLKSTLRRSEDALSAYMKIDPLGIMIHSPGCASYPAEALDDRAYWRGI